MQPGHCANHGDRLIATPIVIFAFLLLAYCITAAGTARFALALGYGEALGYAVGLVLELGKSVLPILVMSLWHARVRVLACRVLACLIGAALLGLVTYSALATHGTVSSAIASVARIGTQHMQTRSGVESDLARVEKQLDALSVPQPPRPVPTVRHALDAEKVPPGIWRDSRECRSIRDSTHFQKACNKVVQLRGELAAGQDYENLSRDAPAREARRSADPRDLGSSVRSLRGHSWSLAADRGPCRRGGACHDRRGDHEQLRSCRPEGPEERVLSGGGCGEAPRDARQ